MEILIFIKEIITIVGLVIAAIIAIPFVIKKISDEKLKKTIEEIDNVNKENIKKVQRLIEKYSFHDNDNLPISIKHIMSIHREIFDLKKTLQLSQGEVATLIICLEGFLRRTIHWYKIINYHILTKSEIINITTSLLFDIYSFMIKNVPTPKNSFLKKDIFINIKMLRYTTNSHMNTYNDFEIGQITDPTSAIYPLIYEKICQKGNIIFYKAMLDNFGLNIRYFIVRLLYLKNYYMPLYVKHINKIAPINYYLVLCGFKTNINLGTGAKSVTFFYANPFPNVTYTDGIKQNNWGEFEDMYLKLGNVFPKTINTSYTLGNEMICVEFPESIVVEYFTHYKRYIELNMKDEKKGIME